MEHALVLRHNEMVLVGLFEEVKRFHAVEAGHEEPVCRGAPVAVHFDGEARRGVWPLGVCVCKLRDAHDGVLRSFR